MALKNIIFDFDGVLADTFDVNLAISQMLLPDVTRDDFVAHHDGNVHAQPVMPFTSSDVEAFRIAYRNRITTGHIEASTPVMKELALYYRLFIISSNDEVGIRATLKAAGCEDLFVAIMGYETHQSKVEKFRLCERGYGVDFSDTVFITDTVGDVKEAHVLQIKTIAVTFGFHPRERLEAASPYQICDSWDEVLAEIETLREYTEGS